MKTFIFYLGNQLRPVPLRFWHLLSIALILWLATPYLAGAFNMAAGFVDIGILHVVLLGFCCWLLSVAGAYLMFRFLLLRMGMPAITEIINHFKLLNLWEQYLTYMACYALLLCSAIGALIAIC